MEHEGCDNLLWFNRNQDTIKWGLMSTGTRYMAMVGLCALFLQPPTAPLRQALKGLGRKKNSQSLRSIFLNAIN